MDQVLSSVPTSIGKKDLHLIPWKPGLNSILWPSTAPVWIRLKNLPYRCWIQKIIFAFTNAINKLIKLDAFTASQKLLPFARVCVEIDISKPRGPRPNQIWMGLKNSTSTALEVEYDVINNGLFTIQHALWYLVATQNLFYTYQLLLTIYLAVSAY